MHFVVMVPLLTIAVKNNVGRWNGAIVVLIVLIGIAILIVILEVAILVYSSVLIVISVPL